MSADLAILYLPLSTTDAQAGACVQAVTGLLGNGVRVQVRYDPFSYRCEACRYGRCEECAHDDCQCGCPRPFEEEP